VQEELLRKGRNASLQHSPLSLSVVVPLQYQTELSRIFSERRRQATNPLAIPCLWLGELIDISVNACYAHWDILRLDLRYTARTLSRAPGFALTAIIVTGLGIGATTAAFSAADHVLLRPFSFPDSNRMGAMAAGQTPSACEL
jgi:hypothetical protein